MVYKLNPRYLRAYERLGDIKSGQVIMIGGRASGKTISVCKYVVSRLMTEGARVMLIRNEHTRINTSILTDLKRIMNNLDTQTDGGVSRNYDIQDQAIKCKHDSVHGVYTMGLRASTTAQTEFVKGLSSIDICVLEECGDIRDQATVDRLMDTLARFPSCVTFFILNTPDAGHWLVKRYFVLNESKDNEGYYELQPKILDNVHYFITTYRDNESLPASSALELEAYGNPVSHKFNHHHYCTDVLGLVAMVKQEQSIIRQFNLECYNNKGSVYTLNDSCVKSVLKGKGFWWVGIDGGAGTTHSAAVIGYRNTDTHRDVVVRETYRVGDPDILQLATVINEELGRLRALNGQGVRLFGDPALDNGGSASELAGVLGASINMLGAYRTNSNPNVRKVYTNRKNMRIGAVRRELKAKSVDNLPLVYVLGECKHLITGLFEGQWRWRYDKLNECVTGDLEQIAPITDLCDAYSYYVLAERPYSASESSGEIARSTVLTGG